MVKGKRRNMNYKWDWGKIWLRGDVGRLYLCNFKFIEIPKIRT